MSSNSTSIPLITGQMAALAESKSGKNVALLNTSTSQAGGDFGANLSFERQQIAKARADNLSLAQQKIQQRLQDQRAREDIQQKKQVDKPPVAAASQVTPELQDNRGHEAGFAKASSFQKNHSSTLAKPESTEDLSSAKNNLLESEGEGLIPLVDQGELQQTVVSEIAVLATNEQMPPTSTLAENLGITEEDVSLIELGADQLGKETIAEIVSDTPEPDNLSTVEQAELMGLAQPIIMPQAAVAGAVEQTQTSDVLKGQGSATQINDSLLKTNTETAASTDIELDADSGTDVFTNLLASNPKATSSSVAPQLLAALAPVSTEQPSTTAAPTLEAFHKGMDVLATTARGFVVQQQVNVPLGQPQWNQAVADKVMWFAAQNITSAELRLDPPELGPMQVRIHVQQDQVQVTFTSQNASVREALDQHSSRLREMFEEAGLTLNMGVSDQGAQQGGEGGNKEGRGHHGDGELEPEVEQAIIVKNLRLLDQYA